MKIKEVEINNFRKLRNKVIIDFQDEILVVGKNNTGKTSVFEVFEKFLTVKKNFKFEDFNAYSISEKAINDTYSEYKRIKDGKEAGKLSDKELQTITSAFPCITLKTTILVEDVDNLAAIKELLYEFTNNKELQLVGKYEIRNCKSLINDYEEYNKKISEKTDEGDERPLETLDFYSYFKRHFFSKYDIDFYATKEGSGYVKPVTSNFVMGLFNIGVITAQREVDDTSEQNKQNISGKIWDHYKKITRDSGELHQEDLFKNSIDDIKGMLNTNYSEIFKELIEEININVLNNESQQGADIASEFDIEEMLKKNSKLQYKIDDLLLPEAYNGLGYSNMMYIFIQIITYKSEVIRQDKLFNILFIEEPESHLHPQMQSTFLAKIGDVLGSEKNIYKIITTHSSYMLQNSALPNIRYFLEEVNNIVVKSMNKYLNIEENKKFEEFLKKYFRINTCDLFFADKAILVEGSVERMLMPVFIKKYDDMNPEKNLLAKQHMTILEVGGAYAHVFNDLLDFLEIKTLIITDIDSVQGNHNSKCECDISGECKDDFKIKTSNAVIKNWFAKDRQPFFIKDLLDNYAIGEKLIKKDGKDREIKKITFQLPKTGELKWGRTFEEQLIIENSSLLESLVISADEPKKVESIIAAVGCTKENRVNEIAIDKITGETLRDNAHFIVQNIEKTDFAFDLLYLDSWSLPLYIEEGFKWLQK